MKSRVVACLLMIAWLETGFGEFKTALPGYHYQFPRDYFDHPDYQTEWWYYTGNITSAEGHHFGFELTFFRQGVSRDTSKTSAWDVRDIYLAHFAFSDLDGGKFYHVERANRAGPGIAGANGERAEIWNGNRPSTITSHVFLKTGDASFDGGCSTAPSDRESPRPLLALGVVLGLVVLRARRRRG